MTRATSSAERTADLVIGETLSRQSFHRHIEAELVVALDGPIDLIDGHGWRTRGTTFLVPPMCAHAFQDYAGRYARLYLTVGYPNLMAWKGRAISSTFDGQDALMNDIRAFLLSDRSTGEAGDLMRRWLQAWPTEPRIAPAIDRRVSDALADIERRADPVRADRRSLAKSAGLSPTWFAALFSEYTGMSLSRYLISIRVASGLRLVAAGASVTAAAAAVGFSDGAHFTRCCRSTYGFTPSHVVRLAVYHVEPSVFDRE